MELTRPALLWLLLLLPAALFIRSLYKPAPVRYSALSGLPGLPKSRARHLPTILMILASILLLTAAARPRLAVGEEEKKMMGVDVALALDVSGSMRAEDLKPSRIEAAKAKVKEFVAGFHDGRTALVAFAGRSFTQCPLTADGDIVAGLVDQLDAGTVALDGTAIGDAIINCLNKFKEPSVNRVIILLTDGENNAGKVDPMTAARAAKEKGVKIYTIGVGTPEGAPVPAVNPIGEKFYLRNPYGGLVLAKVDEKSLRDIADATGGMFFRAADAGALGEVYKKIAELEKREIKVKRTKEYRELFPWFTAAGAAIMLAGSLLSVTRYRVLS